MTRRNNPVIVNLFTNRDLISLHLLQFFEYVWVSDNHGIILCQCFNSLNLFTRWVLGSSVCGPNMQVQMHSPHLVFFHRVTSVKLMASYRVPWGILDHVVLFSTPFIDLLSNIFVNVYYCILITIDNINYHAYQIKFGRDENEDHPIPHLIMNENNNDMSYLIIYQ